MRLFVMAFAALVLAPPSASPQSLPLIIDQAARLTLPRPARDVIVGNPSIADVSVLDGRHLVLTGKALGVTNLLITDGRGQTMYNRQVVVSPMGVNHVEVYRASELSSYACTPSCVRSQVAGEPGGGAPASGGSSPVKDSAGRP